MKIPTYDQMYYSLLKALSDRAVHTNREIADFIAVDMSVSQEARQSQLLSSGAPVFSNRVGWACAYLKKAGLIENIRRGHYRITEEGHHVFSNPPVCLDNNYLCRYPAFTAFIHAGDEKTTGEDVPAAPKESANETPNDTMEQAMSSINEKLAEDIMSEIMAKDSDFFEALVVKLLLKMGYGGSASDSGFVTKKSNDEGIDGIIREDKLGFDQIYIQAKRWNPSATVERPEIQKFSGALRDAGASKGLFITTAKFSDGARKSAEKQHIVLVDGVRLTKLMIEYNLGVSPVATYEVKTIDSDFFSDNND